MSGDLAVQFLDDATRFLEIAADRLAADAAVSTVVATAAERIARSPRTAPAAPYAWFAVVTDRADDIVGIAMRTAPFAPYPPYLLPMEDEAAVVLAEALIGRDEAVRGVNGALPAARVFAEQMAAHAGGEVTVNMRVRLFELGDLAEVAPPPGRLRAARDTDLSLVVDWFRRFHRDADEQAGHLDDHDARDPVGEAGHGSRSESISPDDVAERIRRGVVWLWVDEDDRPVHLTAANPPAFGVTRIGPVFTPKKQRGHGYASAAVAEVSRRLQRDGARVTLFTDQANPTSNKIYLALGFEPVVDMVELAIGSEEPGT